MISFLPAWIKAPFSAFLFILNSVVACLLIYPFALIKIIFPIKPIQSFCSRAMIRIGEIWISGNDLNMAFTQNIQWDIQGTEGLSRDKSYFVTANHQSWTDIVILQHVLNRKIPFIRFFLKYELIYVPLLGWAWWALDFPFMKRYSKKYLQSHPEKRNEDFESTQKACAIFKGKNVAILNFLEGTRFTEQKRELQSSPYQHLLMPKAGGLAFVLNAMGEQFDSFLDVTIFYPNQPVNLWEAFKGGLPRVVIKVRRIPIPQELLKGDYLEDSVYRQNIQAWTQDLWLQKDKILSSFKNSVTPPLFK